MTETAAYAPGDRVQVTDRGLAMLRAIMRESTGREPKPNHHGTVEKILDDGDILIAFDDGGCAPWLPSEVLPLIEGGGPLG
jgi:hypothetical protein